MIYVTVLPEHLKKYQILADELVRPNKLTNAMNIEIHDFLGLQEEAKNYIFNLNLSNNPDYINYINSSKLFECFAIELPCNYAIINTLSKFINFKSIDFLL